MKYGVQPFLTLVQTWNDIDGIWLNQHHEAMPRRSPLRLAMVEVHVLIRMIDTRHLVRRLLDTIVS